MKPALRQGSYNGIKTSLDPVGLISSQHQPGLNGGLEAASLERVHTRKTTGAASKTSRNSCGSPKRLLSCSAISGLLKTDPSEGCISTLLSSRLADAGSKRTELVCPCAWPACIDAKGLDATGPSAIRRSPCRATRKQPWDTLAKAGKRGPLIEARPDGCHRTAVPLVNRCKQLCSKAEGCLHRSDWS